MPATTDSNGWGINKARDRGRSARKNLGQDLESPNTFSSKNKAMHVFSLFLRQHQIKFGAGGPTSLRRRGFAGSRKGQIARQILVGEAISGSRCWLNRSLQRCFYIDTLSIALGPDQEKAGHCRAQRFGDLSVLKNRRSGFGNYQNIDCQRQRSRLKSERAHRNPPS